MAFVSVVVITYNEEKHIARCLESVRSVADEIVVLDSYSEDDTVAIATGYGARIVQQAFAGYVAQKNAAVKLATHDLVLSLDADEALSPELAASIEDVKKDPGHKAYRMNRRAFYCGAFIMHGSWYPEPKTRLFDRREMKWGGLDPHDRILVPPSVQVKKLEGDLLHFICDSVNRHRQRSENFSDIASRSLYNAGVRTNWIKIIGSPAWFFLSDYILRAGFLSGRRGWNIAIIQTRYHFEKYRKLHRLWKGKGRDITSGKNKTPGPDSD